jgi:hypothetical protein
MAWWFGRRRDAFCADRVVPGGGGNGGRRVVDYLGVRYHRRGHAVGRETVYAVVRVVGGVLAAVGAVMFVSMAVHNIRHDHALVSRADWGRLPPTTMVGFVGFGLLAFGLTLRKEPVHGPWRDFLGRIAHLVCIVVTWSVGLRTAEVGARFSAPPEALIGHATKAEMQGALVLFAVAVLSTAAVATWVSGFLPVFTATVTSNESSG